MVQHLCVFHPILCIVSSHDKIFIGAKSDATVSCMLFSLDLRRTTNIIVHFWRVVRVHWNCYCDDCVSSIPIVVIDRLHTNITTARSIYMARLVRSVQKCNITETISFLYGKSIMCMCICLVKQMPPGRNSQIQLSTI